MNIKNPSKPQYNERAWAIDLISAINRSVSEEDIIQRAGGEYSLPEDRNTTLFPDVLLFGNLLNGSVLQGWELKFPDTAINDSELLQNAEEKANRLGLDSFLVWNVAIADLYVRDKTNQRFVFYERLYENRVITTRDDVEKSQDIWIDALKKIIKQIKSFLSKVIILGTDEKKIF